METLISVRGLDLKILPNPHRHGLLQRRVDLTWTHPTFSFITRQTLTGLYPSKVDSLAFAIKSPSTLNEDDVPTLADLRLFSSGGGSELLEWDIDNMCVRVRLNVIAYAVSSL